MKPRIKKTSNNIINYHPNENQFPYLSNLKQKNILNYNLDKHQQLRLLKPNHPNQLLLSPNLLPLPPISQHLHRFHSNQPQYLKQVSNQIEHIPSKKYLQQHNNRDHASPNTIPKHKYPLHKTLPNPPDHLSDLYKNHQTSQPCLQHRKHSILRSQVFSFNKNNNSNLPIHCPINLPPNLKQLINRSPNQKFKYQNSLYYNSLNPHLRSFEY